VNSASSHGVALPCPTVVLALAWIIEPVTQQAEFVPVRHPCRGKRVKLGYLGGEFTPALMWVPPTLPWPASPLPTGERKGGGDEDVQRELLVVSVSPNPSQLLLMVVAVGRGGRRVGEEFNGL